MFSAKGVKFETGAASGRGQENSWSVAIDFAGEADHNARMEGGISTAHLPGFDDLSILLRPAVYALYYKGELVYIGQSKQLLTRLYQHKNNYLRSRRDKPVQPHTSAKAIHFDAVKAIPVERGLLDRVERELIDKFKPRYNVQHSGRTKTKEPLRLEYKGVPLTINDPNRKPAPAPVRFRRVS